MFHISVAASSNAKSGQSFLRRPCHHPGKQYGGSSPSKSLAMVASIASCLANILFPYTILTSGFPQFLNIGNSSVNISNSFQETPYLSGNRSYKCPDLPSRLHTRAHRVQITRCNGRMPDFGIAQQGLPDNTSNSCEDPAMV
ncbi:hypothetical protein NCS57_01399400 [Fusarium keratoplasticum]|uniref:Uncharacterized protein n=1 Tax=Fusarium keratoplasticum TaxID=1328300 RepID=A0ACC0QE68_9HYPO|nr:hypothetical protein NCS57_01399400 [Fusarium keratoplasticum]KAI8650650.1 hypothetical protein NCS57_01399400 [Fusarium keratoplasticum]